MGVITLVLAIALSGNVQAPEIVKCEAFEDVCERHFEAPQPEPEPQPEQQTEEVTYEPVYYEQPEVVQQVGYIDASEGYVEEAGYYDVPVYSGGLTAQSGVNYYDGRTETFYSSAVLWHYRTNEWTVDDEGFYRDPEGRYVVAASDMEQGTVFQGSKGECIVLDSGCAPGVTDYYVRW